MGKNYYPTISVIVPVYNAEPYLPQCLESILAQDYRDFELILVNDGSTDSSGDICERYAARDSRIRVITQSNGGVSNARNAGLDVASGKYVAFVDADDWVDPDYLSILLGNMTGMVSENSDGRNNVILSACGYCINEKRKDSPLHGIFSLAETQTAIFSVNGYISCYPVCKLFDREQILSHSLHFDSSLSIGEDYLFVMQYVSFEVGVVHYDLRKPYHYRRGNSSVTYQRFQKVNTPDKGNLSGIKALYRCSEYLIPNKSVHNAYKVAYIQEAERTLRIMTANDYQNPELYRQLRRNIIKGWWCCLRSPYNSLRNKLAICLSVISPKLSLLAWRLTHKVK